MNGARISAVVLCLAPLLCAGQAADDDYSLPPLESRNAEELSQALSVFVERIEVRGVTAIAAEEIAALTAPYEGRNVTSAELQELRLALSSLYLEQGFVSSGVLLPDQSIAGGVIVYQAVEGELTRIEVEGDPQIRDAYVEKRLARHIDGPVRIDDVQYALQYLQNDPNIVRLDARLAPGDMLGESVLRVAVDEPTRFELDFGVNNHRATSTGEREGSIGWHSRNWAGLGEIIDVTTSVSDGADNTAISFEVPISRRNTSLQAYASDSDSSIVEARLRELDIESFTETRGIRLRQPLLDRLNKSFSVTVGYESRHNESMLGGVPFSLSPGAVNGVSETNVALLGFDWTGRDDDHVLAARLVVRHGDDYQDATLYTPPLLSGAPGINDDLFIEYNPTGADGRFDVLQTQLLFLRSFGRSGRAELLVRASGQFTNDPLMSIEKISIGGFDTVRGYPENFFVRDNGFAASLEVRLPLPGAGAVPNPRHLTLVPFIDYGRSWDEVDTDTISSTRDTSDPNSITGVGLGLLWQPVRGFSAELFWGADIQDDLAAGQDPRDFRDASLQDEGIHFALNYARYW